MASNINHEKVLLFIEEHLSQLVKLKVASRATYKQYEEAMMNYLTADACEDKTRTNLYELELETLYRKTFIKLLHAIESNHQLSESNLVRDFVNALTQAEDPKFTDLFCGGEDTSELVDTILYLSPGTSKQTEDAFDKMSTEELLPILEKRFYHCMPEWIDDLPLIDLKLLRDLVNTEDGRLEAPITVQMLLVEDLNMVDRSLGDDEGAPQYVLYEDIKNTLAPHLDGAIHRKAQNNEGFLEQLFMGIMNMVGVIDEKDAIQTMKQLLQQAHNELTNKDVDHFFVHSMLVRFHRGGYVCSPDGLLFSRLADEGWDEDIRDGITTWIPTNLQEVMAHGEYPYLVPYRKEEKALWNVLHQQNSANEASSILTMLYMDLQSPELDHKELIENFGNYYNFKDYDEVQRVMPILIDFSNAIPKFFLKGHSSAEIIHREKPSFFPKKIGRNDPCPCGSGKKYKYCCGK